MTIELPCAFVDRMAEERADADFFAEPQRSQDGVLQQPCPDSVSRPIGMNRQSPQNCYRYGLGHVSSDAAGRVLMQDSACSKRVVTDDLGGRANNKRARCAFTLVLKRTPLEPQFQLRAATTKSIDSVRRAEKFGPRDAGSLAYRSQGARLVSKRPKAFLLLTGASKISTKRLNVLASNAKTVRSNNTCCAFSYAASSMKAVRVLPCT